MDGSGFDNAALPLCGRLATFASNLRWVSLAEPVRTATLDHVIDTVGCCVANVGTEGWRSLRSVITEDGGSAQSSAIGVESRVPSGQAALMNGYLARAGEFDDMAMPDLHPAGVIVPAVFAAAERSGCSGARALTAVAAGLELLVRLGRAAYDAELRTSRFLVRGLDATAICGAVAAAAAAAVAEGLTAPQVAHAMAVAVSLAGGSLEGNRSGGVIKSFQSGFAARSGVAAQQLAAVGVTGPELALEGRYGFYQCFVGGRFDELALAGELGERWELSDLRYKPYPSNYYTHAGIDAALALRARGLDPARVVAITQRVATPMLHTMGRPLAEKQRPATGYAAKFSGPYTFVSALLGGTGLGLGPDDFSDVLAMDARRRDLMAKVTVEADERCNEVFPSQAPCIVEVETSDANHWREEVWVNRGSVQNPLTSAEVATKFTVNAGQRLPDDRARALYDHLAHLPTAGNLLELMRALRAVPEGNPDCVIAE